MRVFVLRAWCVVLRVALGAALRVCIAYVHCLCALRVCALRVRCVRVCGVIFVYALLCACIVCVCVACVRYVCALRVGSACCIVYCIACSVRVLIKFMCLWKVLRTYYFLMSFMNN